MVVGTSLWPSLVQLSRYFELLMVGSYPANTDLCFGYAQNVKELVIKEYELQERMEISGRRGMVGTNLLMATTSSPLQLSRYFELLMVVSRYPAKTDLLLLLEKF